MTSNTLSAKDEALLILEYLENEQMSKTFLNFLDENKHLHELRSRLYHNYEHPEKIQHETNPEVIEFQTFFNLSQQIISQLNNEQITFLSNNNNNNNSSKNSNDLFFDDDFLNDLISQTPPMDYQHDLPDTPVPSVLPVNNNNNDNDEFNSTMSSIEQLFALQHDTPAQPIVQITSDTNTNSTSSRLSSTVPYTKCIVVTQDFLQSMYNQQSTITHHTQLSSLHRPKRRRRRLKLGKENYSQQRKIMPRTSPDHR